MTKKNKANKNNRPNKIEVKRNIAKSYEKCLADTSEQYHAGYYKRTDIIAENEAFLDQFRKFKLKEENRKSMGNSGVNKVFYYCYGHCLWRKIKILLEGVIYNNGIYMPESSLEPGRTLIIEDISQIYSAVLELKNEAVDVLDFSIGLKVNEDIDFSPIEKECIRIKRNVLKDAANIAYNAADYDGYVSLAELAVENGSVQACSTLVSYYIGNDDLNMANHYFEKTLSMPINKPLAANILLSIETAKLMAYSYMYHGYYNAGDYERAISIAEQSVSFLKSTDLLGANKEYNTIAQQWIEECNKAIAELSKEKASDRYLKQYFEDSVISLMSEDVKIYIDTSLDIYDYIKGCGNNLDYSATIMPIMKAVEALTIVIMNRFLAFLHAKENVILRYVNKYLQYDGVLLSSLDRFEIGKVEKSIAWLPEEHRADSAADIRPRYYRPNRYFTEFCENNGIDQSEETIRKFAYMVHLVREKRNLAAHKNRVVEDDASICFDYLLTGLKFIKFLLTTFSFCFEETQTNTN